MPKTPRRYSTSYTQHIQRAAHKYMLDNNIDVLNLDVIVDHLIDVEGWAIPPVDPRKKLKRDIARALAEERWIDPQGRDVKRMHAVRILDPDGQYK